jgi:O-antigen ligase
MGVIRLNGISEMFGHPNALAATSVFSLPAWYFLYRIREAFSRTWPPFWHKWFRRGLLIYPPLAISSVVLTNSRGGMLALILFAALTLLRSHSLKRMLYLAAVSAVIACIAWATMDDSSKGRFLSIWNPAASTESAKVSAEGRLQGFQAGMEMFRRFPLTGVGIGNFAQYRARFVDGSNLDAHNLPGQALAEIGLIGSGAFLIMVLAILVNCRQTIAIGRYSSDETLVVLSELARAVRDALLLALFCGLFCHNLYWFIWLWFAAFVLLAACLAGDQLKDIESACASILAADSD